MSDPFSTGSPFGAGASSEPPQLGILAQYRACKRGNQGFHRVTEHEIASNEAAGRFNCSLTIKRSKQGIAQFATTMR